jgi:hypothetical protein
MKNFKINSTVDLEVLHAFIAFVPPFSFLALPIL